MPRPAHRLFPLGLAVIVTMLVAGCQLGTPGGAPAADGEVTANAVAGDAIEVTALDAPPSAEAAVEPAAAATGAEAAAPPEVASPAAEPVAEAAVVPVPEPAPAPVVPEEIKSEAQLACEKRDGKWSAVGSGDLRICVFTTRDSGKQCDRESDCESVCLARSRTCAPVKPLLGCHEILQDNGGRVTLCIE